MTDNEAPTKFELLNDIANELKVDQSTVRKLAVGKLDLAVWKIRPPEGGVKRLAVSPSDAQKIRDYYAPERL